MSVVLEFELESCPLERANADLLTAGLFSDDRPLRGGAARVDWRLCGLISQMLLRGRITGERGEAVLLPSTGQLASPRILLLGLGKRSQFRMASAQDAMRDAVERSIDMTVNSVIVSPLGIPSDDFPRHAQAVVGGALEAARQTTGTLGVRLAIRRNEADRAFRSLEVAISAGAAEQIRLVRSGGARTGSHLTLGGDQART